MYFQNTVNATFPADSVMQAQFGFGFKSAESCLSKVAEKTPRTDGEYIMFLFVRHQFRLFNVGMLRAGS